MASSNQPPNDVRLCMASSSQPPTDVRFCMASSSQPPNDARLLMASSSQPPNIANWGGGHGEDPYKWKEELPIGIKFRPTDQVLLLDYLFFKSIGQTFPPGIISDEEIYDYPPHILQGRGFKHDDGRMYFFTCVKRKDNSLKKSERSVKDVGYWKATQARVDVHKTIDNKKTVIGTKTPLTYYQYLVGQNGEKVFNHKGQRVARKQNWLMTEYRLEYTKPPEVELALCVVYYHQISKKEPPSQNVRRTKNLLKGGRFRRSTAQGGTEEPQ